MVQRLVPGLVVCLSLVPASLRAEAPEMTKDAVRLLDHLKIDKAHVVGYSMGGGIALQMAARYPERVRTATLGGAGLPLPERAQLMEALADSLEQGKGLGPLIVALTPKE